MKTPMATARERFINVMRRRDLSRGIPLIEWAPWWDLTLKNWVAQGLPEGMTLAQSYDYFGLDHHQMYGKPPLGPGAKLKTVRTEADYDELRPQLYPDPAVDEAGMTRLVQRQREGDLILWLNFLGPFWWPRTLFGIEAHLCAFYEQPALMKRMIRDLAEFTARTIEHMLGYYEPDILVFSEDMAYNHGSMISPELFAEFIAPFYRRVTPIAAKREAIPFVDCDGFIESLVPLFEAVGVQAILPLERVAGVDVNRIRQNHPKWGMLGGFDKTVMHRGEAAIRAEFQRIKPAVLSGGFVPSVDHQTPPAVSLEDYKLYVKLFKEFSEEVAQTGRRARTRRMAIRADAGAADTPKQVSGCHPRDSAAGSQSSAQTPERPTASARKRFQNVLLRGDLSEGLVVWEWAPWWDKTLAAWRAQGLPEDLAGQALLDYFGLDAIRQFWVGPTPGTKPDPPQPGPAVRTETDYCRLLPFKAVEWPPITEAQLDEWNECQAEGNTIFWMTLPGPFGHTRPLLGIEPHLLAFYEQPRLMKRMIEDLVEFTIPIIEKVGRSFQPDFMTFFEDMSFNHGPMIGPAVFEEFIAPFYREVVPVLHRYGIPCIIDSDGDVEPMIPWFRALGADGILPLERMAGNDVNRIRRNHPDFKLIGGFDKIVMARGEEAIRAEFERIRPAVLAGRFVPGVDHQTPPGVSLDDYRTYVRVFREFSDEVAREARRAAAAKCP